MQHGNKFFIIDAMAMAFRNYHAFAQRPLINSKGVHTSAVYGSAMFLTKLIEEERPNYLVVATDSKEKTFRHDIYPQYKANRTEMPADLAGQLPYFFELFSAMGIPVLRQPGMEADDLIGSLCKKFAGPHFDCFIVSGDKDFMQLINDHVFLYSPKKNEPALIVDEKGVQERFGCKPSQVIDILSIMGDASDNVPGVHGIGDKGAAKLIGQYHSLEGIFENLSEIPNLKLKNALERDREQAFLSKRLVTIKTDIPLELTTEEIKLNGDALANSKLLDLYQRMEFRNLTTRLKDTLESGNLLHRQGFTAPQAIIPKSLPNQISSKDTTVDPVPQEESPSFAKFGTSYLVANTPELLIKLMQELNEAASFSFDTETTGLDRISDRPIGISVSTKSGTAWYIPLLQKHLTSWLTAEVITNQLKPVFEDTRKLKIAHNLKFDLQMLRNIGINLVSPFGDTMLASYVLNPLSREHNLDYCSLEVLKFRKIPTTYLMGDRYETPMSEVDLDKLTVYACEDADVVLKLYHAYLPKIKEQGLEYVYQEIEMPLVPILATMERLGVYVNADALHEISMKLDRRAKELEEIIHKEAGEVFNINSPKQLQKILFEKLAIHQALGLTRIKKTKSGYSTDVSVLESMEEHPLPRALLEFRTVTKLKNTYVDALPQLMDSTTGRIHTHFHQTGTATGRLSSSDPNLQNIPIRKSEGREIRKAFSTSSPNRVILSADYSQIELRLLAHISKDEALKEAFLSDQDIHTATASRIFGVPPHEVTPDLRSNAKAINFGIIYGMGPQRLARQTGVSMAEAKAFIEKYFEGFPKIRNYIEEAKRKARDLGYSITMTGRRRPIPEIHAKDRAVMVNGENMAVNSPLQGSAADLVKLAMIKTQKRLSESGFDACMLLQVHDELVFECDKKCQKEVIELVRESMEQSMTLDVPLKVEVGVGANWLDAH